MKVIEQIRTRPSFFNGAEIDKANFRLICSVCTTNSIINFKQMLDGAWGWKENLKPEEIKIAALVFGINLANRSIGNGMSSIVKHKCKCGAEHYIYFWFHEYRHSCYDISLKGIAKK